MNPLQKKIAKALGIDALPEWERDEMMLRVGAVLYQNLLLRVVPMLSNDEQVEFEKILDGKSEVHDVFGFLKSKIPDLEIIIDEETLAFKQKADNVMDQIG